MSDSQITDAEIIATLKNELARADNKVKACSGAMTDAVKEKRKFQTLVRMLMECYLELEDRYDET